MTGADTYQPTLSEFPNAICFPLAYVPVCLTSPLHLFLPTSLKYIERHMGSGKAWRRPTLPQSASLLHNFIMHFVSKVRVSMSVFLIKSVIDEAKVLKMHFRKVPAPSGPCRSLLKTSVQRPHRNWQCSYDFCNRNLIVNEYKKVAEFFVHFFQPYLYVCLIYKHLYIYKHVFLLNNCTYLIWFFYESLSHLFTSCHWDPSRWCTWLLKSEQHTKLLESCLLWRGGKWPCQCRNWQTKTFHNKKNLSSPISFSLF